MPQKFDNISFWGILFETCLLLIVSRDETDSGYYYMCDVSSDITC